MKVEKLKRPSETRKEGEALIKCSSCRLESTYKAFQLTEPVDVYGDLIDDYYKDVDSGAVVHVQTLVRTGEAPPKIIPPEELVSDKKAVMAAKSDEKTPVAELDHADDDELASELKEAQSTENEQDLIMKSKPKSKKKVKTEEIAPDDEEKTDNSLDVYEDFLDKGDDDEDKKDDTLGVFEDSSDSKLDDGF